LPFVGLVPGMTYYVEAQTFEGGYNHSTIITTDVTTPMQVDLLVDSDNDDGFNIPDGSPLEDRLQTVPYSTSTPGKILIADGNDLNGNGSPDYADWAAGVAGSQFAPFQFRIPATTDLSKTTIEFDYSAADPSASGTPPGALRLWLKDASAAKSLSDYIAGNTAIAAGTLPFGAAVGGWITLNGFIEAVLAGAQTITATATTGTSPATQSASDSANVDSVQPSIDIITTIGTEHALDISEKNTSGGYVVLNDDNDNNQMVLPLKSAFGAKLPRQPKPDTAMGMLVKGEHDLGTAELNAVDLGGTYTITFDSTHLRIWQPSEDGTNYSLVISGITKFDASVNTTLSLEGFGESAAKAGDSIQLLWEPPGNVAAPAALSDEVKETVFTLEGAQYVPGFGRYEYTVDVPGGLATGPFLGWSYNDGTGNTVAGGQDATQSIAFSGGPAIAKVIYAPAPGFEATRYVYVVSVNATPGAITSPNGAAVVVGTPAYQVKGPRSPITFSSQVTFQGPADPVDPTAQRGLQYMQAGFIQTANVNSLSATYGASFIHSPLQGGSFIDAVTAVDGAQKSQFPWYDSPSNVGAINGQGLLGIFEPSTNDLTRTLNESDRPKVHIFEFDGKGAFLTAAAVQYHFAMSVGVHTLDSEGNASAFYYLKAATQWDADYSGTVNRKAYVPVSAGPKLSAIWAAGAAFNTGQGVDGVLLLLPGLPAVNTVAQDIASSVLDWLPGL
ncbi:MAG TPA: hypothetical protein VFC78_06975, partial [Tepidisphaeraceae bacterium]|nr:hypothetical protein [Tepidisphaeraceae bacterium]